ncbi:hypothetical protein PG997_007039 [Apiospora hydei]|uniref:Uncharacterized protein n=1 Tax=Apiospora hydei TaxID=1337664 RepID=A0ABR1WQH3_9PEZI
MRTDLGVEAQNLRRGARRGLDPWDEAEARRDPLEFLGDGVPTEEGPPVAWVRLWNGKYSNLYGGYVPPSLGEWGYVMWDERRWRDLGALELVAEQWETAPKLVKSIKDRYHWSPTDES